MNYREKDLANLKINLHKGNSSEKFWYLWQETCGYDLLSVLSTMTHVYAFKKIYKEMDSQKNRFALIQKSSWKIDITAYLLLQLAPDRD